jgi:hypothetical protein
MMQKFMSIPVTNEQNQLVAVNGIVLIEQASLTTVTITYDGGKVVTLTHATVTTGDEDVRDDIQVIVESALKTAWDKPVYVVSSGELSKAVSGIAVA